MKSWRYLVPNFFTAVSLSLGIASILLATEVELETAAGMCGWCVLLDKADGTAARLLSATSRFGSEFDSMADLVSFGLAPAYLVYSTGRHVWGLKLGEPLWLLLVAGAGLYALLTAMRLARFNLDGHRPGRRHFEGLPSPLCGTIMAATVLVSFKHHIPVEWMKYFPGVAVLLGLGMVSRLPVPKLVPRKNLAFNIFQIANIVFTYVVGFAMVLPEYLLGLALFYMIVGTTQSLIRPPEEPSLKKIPSPQEGEG
jgi:CDP-diacylglycerol--serine O-phosphatidyltransferase